MLLRRNVEFASEIEVCFLLIIMDKQTLLAVLQFLKKNNLKETEELLKKEAHLSEAEVKKENDETSTESDVSQALAAYKSEGDPSVYEDYYTSLKGFIEKSLDVHKCELSMILYPVFVHMYLELVYNGHEEQASEFFEKFSVDQEWYYQADLQQLSTVCKREHMTQNQLLDNFKGSKFTIRMSRDSYNQLKRHLLEKKQKILLTIIQDHLFIDVFDGVPRSKQQIDLTAGGMTGEAKRDANKVKVLYGLLKEPDISIPVEDDEEAAGDGEDKPKKKKAKKDPALNKKHKNDPNAPASNRIPLPEMNDQRKMEKVRMMREAARKVTLSPDNPPSICLYTLLNAHAGVTSVDISEDSSLMAAGFADSHIRVWTLTPNKLRTVKPTDDLEIIDKEAVRLWSLLMWTNLVCYKGHNFPVWDVKFGPQGHYFVSAGHDRTARLWSTDHYQPLRVFAGHLSDVDAVQFHPNCNYLATGSTDRTLRLWDVANGNCVRLMTGHKGTIHCIVFSPDGKYIASAGADRCVLVWELAHGDLVGHLKGHEDTIYTLAFSRDGNVLASGGLDNHVRLWDFTQLTDDQEGETPALNDSSRYAMESFPTKSTPVLCLHFTRKNLLLASGAFQSHS